MNLQTNYILEVSLASLHFETKEWIKEFEFYGDELSLFKEMLESKTSQNALEKQVVDDIILNIGIILNTISGELLIDITAHENYLSALLSNNTGTNEQNYREKHKVLFGKISSLKEKVLQQKKRVYRVFHKDQFAYRQKYGNK